jgi:hypothetical protein
MISDSAPWKNGLLRDADLIELWAAKKAVTERRSALIERKVFFAAYAIRRLNEAQKISSSFGQRSLRVTRFPAQGAPVSPENSHRFDKLYEIGEGVTEQLQLFRLLNLLIHSLVFVEELDGEGQVIAFWVTSPNASKKGLYGVRVSDFVDMVRAVGRDYPSTIVRTRTEEGGVWETWIGDGSPPPEVQARLAAAEEDHSPLADLGSPLTS